MLFKVNTRKRAGRIQAKDLICSALAQVDRVCPAARRWRVKHGTGVHHYILRPLLTHTQPRKPPHVSDSLRCFPSATVLKR